MSKYYYREQLANKPIHIVIGRTRDGEVHHLEEKIIDLHHRINKVIEIYENRNTCKYKKQRFMEDKTTADLMYEVIKGVKNNES